MIPADWPCGVIDSQRRIGLGTATELSTHRRARLLCTTLTGKTTPKRCGECHRFPPRGRDMFPIRKPSTVSLPATTRRDYFRSRLTPRSCDRCYNGQFGRGWRIADNSETLARGSDRITRPNRFGPAATSAAQKTSPAAPCVTLPLSRSFAVGSIRDVKPERPVDRVTHPARQCAVQTDQTPQ